VKYIKLQQKEDIMKKFIAIILAFLFLSVSVFAQSRFILKNQLRLTVIIFSLVFISCLCQSDFPVLKGPYLGQKPPGMTPEIFAPGIMSTNADDHFFGFTDDGELAVLVQSGLKFLELKDGLWTKPQRIPFDTDNDLYYTTAPKGKTVYFLSNRPLEKNGPLTEFRNVWTSTMSSSGWSEPELMEYPFNAGGPIGYPSFTDDGSIYVYSGREGGFGMADIYVSRLVNGRYTELMNIGEPVNTEYTEADPFIALDESYLLFVSRDRPDGLGEFDIYLSFKNDDSYWTEPINLGRTINSNQNETCPKVTYDLKYLFYTSRKAGSADIYWVDAKIIEELKLKNLK
jgi:hypothetical protein